MEISRKEIHNAVKNEIHNSLGITKEEILDVIRQETRQELVKLVEKNESFLLGSVSDLVRETVRSEMLIALSREDFPNITRSMRHIGTGEGHTFSDYITNEVKNTLLEEMRSSFDVKLVLEAKQPNSEDSADV